MNADDLLRRSEERTRALDQRIAELQAELDVMQQSNRANRARLAGMIAENEAARRRLDKPSSKD